MISKVKEVCIFFNYSPKRNGFLSAVIKDQYPENARKKPLITLYTTRWVERSEAYEHFLRILRVHGRVCFGSHDT